jgi:hypothetical protein
MWVYKSAIGNIYIKRLPDGLYGMEYKGVIWEACDTPQAEADNVYMQCTGCPNWDMHNTANEFVPTDLSGWIRC